MAEIRNEQDLRKWLEGKPRQVIATVMSRAILRAFPAIYEDLSRPAESEPWRALVLLPMMRALLLSHCASVSSALSVRQAVESAGRMLGLVGGHSENTQCFIRALSDVTVSAGLGQHPSSHVIGFLNWLDQIRINDVFAQDDVFSSDDIFQGNAVKDDIWKSILDDVENMSVGQSILQSPLWPRRMPKWADIGWGHVEGNLFNSGQDGWDFWARWYHSRLTGREWGAISGFQVTPGLEAAFAKISNEDWDNGPAHVNPILKRIEDEYYKEREPISAVITAIEEPDTVVAEAVVIPPQEPRAFQFAPDADGRIGLAPLADPGEGLLDTPERQEDYQELRNKAEDLQALGLNRLGNLARPVERLLQVSPDITKVRAKILWSRMNTLRIAMKGHEAAQDIVGDERRLDSVVADRLRDLVDTANVFTLGDPTLLDLDEARPGPREVIEAKAEVALLGGEAVAQLKTAEFLNDEAKEVISEQLDDLSDAPNSLDGRQEAAVARRTVRNVISSMLAAGYKRVMEGEIGFATRHVRAGIYAFSGEKIGEYVFKNYQSLLSYALEVFHRPELQRVIDAIASGFSSLP